MMRPVPRRALAVLGVLLTLAAAGGCSRNNKKKPPAPRVFSGAEVQQVIDRDLPRSFQGLRVGRARCPATLDPKPEQPATCSLPVEGIPVRIRVDRVDANTFKVISDQAVIPLARLESALATAVAKKGGQTYSIDCGDEAVKVFDPPGDVTCIAAPAKGAPVRLTVTISDKQGNFTFKEEESS